MKHEKLVEKIIKIMQETGFIPDQMLEVLKLAKEKYKLMKKTKKTSLHKQIQYDVYNSKRYNRFGRKEIVEKLLIKKIKENY